MDPSTSRANFNGVHIDIPEGWQDDSLITLVGPAPPEFKTMSLRQTPSQRPNVVLKRAHVLGEPVDLDGFAKIQERQMSEIGQQVEVLDRGEITIDEQARSIRALTVDFQLSTPPLILRQLQIYFQVQQEFFILCGTAMVDDKFPKLRQQLLDIACGLRFD